MFFGFRNNVKGVKCVVFDHEGVVGDGGLDGCGELS